MFEEALDLKTYVEITQETEEQEKEVLHNGEITCREFKKGQFFYHIKPQRGKALWFSHEEVLGKEKIDMAIVEERSVEPERKRR